PSNYGIQSAYTIKISSLYAVGCYGNFIWRNGIHEQIIGGHLTLNLNDSTSSAFSVGTAYRVGDALLPNLALGVGRNKFAFFYEFNISRAVVYHRPAFELSYTRNL
ncbi:MAG: hypothetical protein ABIN89_23095, partial [Chitinophagaceae bacterium]